MIPGIRQVQIQNFKSIERAVVDLAPLTVLVGQNGAGKSNFVESLTFLQQIVSTGLEQALRYRSFLLPEWMVWEWGKHRMVGLRVELELADGSRADYAVELRVDFGTPPTVSRERCRVEKASGLEAVFEVAEGHFVREIAGIRSQLVPDRLALFAASATEDFRPVYDFLTSIRAYSILPKEVNGSLRPADSGMVLVPEGSNAASVLKAIIERSPEDHARIVRLLGQAVEGITAVKVEESAGKQLYLRFEKNIGDERPIPFSGYSMSDGTLRLLGLLLAVYQPSRPSVLMVEEPEATVHPAVAQLVTEILLAASNERQVLVTTHSPDILDAKELSDDQIRVVTQRHGRTIVAPLSKASRQAIRDRLYTPGELLRINELDEDADQAVAAAENLDLFPPLPVPS
jgi:predicted ATPase